MEKQPASSTESTLAKREKNGKKKIQRIFKKIYFPIYLANNVSRKFQTSRDLPMQYGEHAL